MKKLIYVMFLIGCSSLPQKSVEPDVKPEVKTIRIKKSDNTTIIINPDSLRYDR